MNWLLVIVLLLIGFRIYRGYKKGAIHMMLSFAALILSVVVTGFLGPVFSQHLCDSKIIVGYVSDAVNKSLGVESSVQKATGQMTDHSINRGINQQQQEELLQQLGLPQNINKALLKGKDDTISNVTTATVHNFATFISEGLAKIIIRGITYIVIFLIAKIGLRIIIMFLGILDRIPGVEDASKLAGAGIGAISGFVMVWVGFLFLLALSSTRFGMECYRCINESTVLTVLYNNNLLLKWILQTVNG